MKVDLRSWGRRALRSLSGGLCALALVACAESVEIGRGQGVVEALDPAAPQITIEHGDIEGLMPAMTMTFGVADPALLEGLEPGDRIAFALRHAGDTYTVTEIVEDTR